MTANQVAMAAVQLDKEKLEEAKRHNAASEQEIERSNLAQEDIARKRAEIEEFAAQAKAEYDQHMAMIQEQYNNWYMQFQTANEQQKREIEAQLALLEEEKVQAENKYKEDMAEIASRKTDIEQQEADEKKRSNEAIEGLKSQELALSWWETAIKDKQVEYQNTFWNGSLANQKLQIQNQNWFWVGSLTNESRKIENDYDIATLGLERDLAKLKLDAWNAKRQYGINFADMIWKGVNAIKPNFNIRLW